MKLKSNDKTLISSSCCIWTLLQAKLDDFFEAKNESDPISNRMATDNQVEVTNLVNEFGSARGKIKEQATLKLFVAFYEFLKKFQRLNRCWM